MSAIAGHYIPQPISGGLVKWIKRHAGSLSFGLVVGVPTAIGGVYYGVIAAPQYVSEIRFGVRPADPLRGDSSAIFTGMAAASEIGLNSYVVTQAIASQPFVTEIDRRIGLRKRYGGANGDALSRLDDGATAEQLLDFWHGKVDPFFDLSNGSITVKVRAFTPGDAAEVAQAVLDQAEKLVNDMSERSRRDTVRAAEGEVARAETRMKDARTALLNLRLETGLIDPARSAEATLGLAARQREEVMNLSSEREALGELLAPDAPGVLMLDERLKAHRNQLDRLTRDAGAPLGNISAEVATRFESIAAELEIAQKVYGATLEVLQKQRLSAERQAVYLSPFVAPSLPQSSTEPARLKSVGLVLACAFGAWCLLALAVQSARDHMG